MIQAPADSPGIVDQIVATLISKFHPRRIYLFGSRARGDARADSDYDFLIEIENEPEGVMVTRQGMTWLEHFPGTEIQVHLRYKGALERRKDDPGTIDWDVIREGKLVFAVGDLPVLRAGAERGVVSEPRHDPPPSLSFWIDRADKDLRLSRHLASDFLSWKEPICFHCQQSAEKFLKALVVSQWKHPLKTHDLTDLLRSAGHFGFNLSDIERDCWSLTRYAVSARYPDDDDPLVVGPQHEISEHDARQAIAAAERIARAIRAALS